MTHHPLFLLAQSKVIPSPASHSLIGIQRLQENLSHLLSQVLLKRYFTAVEPFVICRTLHSVCLFGKTQQQRARQFAAPNRVSALLKDTIWFQSGKFPQIHPMNYYKNNTHFNALLNKQQRNITSESTFVWFLFLIPGSFVSGCNFSLFAVIDVMMWGKKAGLLVVIADPEGKQFGGWLLLNHDGSAGEKLFAKRNVAGLNQHRPTFIQEAYSFLRSIFFNSASACLPASTLIISAVM